MHLEKRTIAAALAAACGLALFSLVGCGGSDTEPDGDMDAGEDAGPDGGGFDVAAHLISAEDAGAEGIAVRVLCATGGCDVPDGGDPFGIEEVATFTAPTEGDYVADWDDFQYFLFASDDGFFTQFIPWLDEGGTYTLDLDGIPEYGSAVAGVIFATQDLYAPSPVLNRPIHAVGPGGLEFDFQTDARGRYGLHDLPPGSYSFALDFHEQDILLGVSSGDGLTYEDLYFDDPEQLD
jgi:hypothetical protein